MGIQSQELNHIRLVTGEVNPMTGENLPVSGTIPLPELGTGQFKTSGTDVIGASSAFLSDFMTRDKQAWLYAASIGEIRRIRNIISDAKMIIEWGFSADISSNEDVYMVFSKYKNVVTKNTHDTENALVQEVTLKPGETDIQSDFNFGVAPISYKAQSAELTFHISE
jgi:hypothetical protein